MSWRPRDPVWGFALRAAAWLVPSFALWYLAAAAHGRPVAWIARAIVDGYTGGVVTALEWDGRIVALVTNIRVALGGGQEGILAPEINPLLYTYGAALFLALALASRVRLSRVLLGVAILIPFQAWGVAFEALAELGVRAGPEVALRAGIQGLKRELVPLGYQFGSLIFPTLVPVVLWAAFGGLRTFLPVTATSSAR